MQTSDTQPCPRHSYISAVAIRALRSPAPAACIYHAYHSRCSPSLSPAQLVDGYIGGQKKSTPHPSSALPCRPALLVPRCSPEHLPDVRQASRSHSPAMTHFSTSHFLYLPCTTMRLAVLMHACMCTWHTPSVQVVQVMRVVGFTALFLVRSVRSAHYPG